MNWVCIGSCNGLSPVQCQVITWTYASLLSIGPLETTTWWWQVKGLLKKQRTGPKKPTLAQVMTCWLMALSHYLKQYWLIFNGFCCIHIKAIPEEIFMIPISKISVKITLLKILLNLLGANESMRLNHANDTFFSMVMKPCFDTLRPKQNGCHFTDNIFKCIFSYEKYIWLKFHWSLLQRVQLIIPQHWFR